MFACIHGSSLPETPSLADFAYSFSPLLEETAANTVVIDTAGCELIFGSAYELANEIVNSARNARDLGGLGCGVNVALAGNPEAAILAARFFDGITYIAPGEELTALGELPVERLRPESQLSPKSKVQSPKSKKSNSIEKTLDVGRWTLDEPEQTLDVGRWTMDDQRVQEIFETLRLWGVRTLRDFAELPTTGVAERLGQEGIRLQQLATGKTERHLKLRQPALVFENSIELEHALAELEPLSFIFARLLNQLCANLNAYALATNEITVQLKLEDQTLHERKLNLPYPMRDHKVFLKLLLLDTEIHPPGLPVVGVRIAFEPVKPREHQNGLFIPLSPHPEKLELILARLAKLVGAENSGSPELIDTHRPSAFRMKKFSLKEKERRRKRNPQSAIRNPQFEIRNPQSAVRNPQFEIRNSKFLLGFRVFRPPLRAMVDAGRGYPTRVTAWGANQSLHGKVVRLGGPWRTTGDWWRADSWARDEWDVAVENGSGKSEQTDSPLQILCRLYREIRSGEWFVEGTYD